MKYLITESRLNSIMTKYMDNYLSKYEVIEDRKIVSWGQDENNQLIYDTENEILFVRQDVMELFRSVFSLDHHEYVEFIKDYMANKGYFVRRII